MPKKHIVFRVHSLKTSVLRGKVVRFLLFSAKNHVFQQNSNFGEGIDQ